jgi:hypothetical protein
VADELQSDQIDWSVTTWEGSWREQIERWSRMSLDDILDAQDEMAELASELAPHGKEGKLEKQGDPTHEFAFVKEEPSKNE